ncbi:hypothetical protein [Rhodococcus globerulus]|uniref:Uncharacterized protein n=1 Tax=Rhodococcus globerulus TaxID=33008 RepID=A0ABU4C572_RHOGO|nr:hypothetical protein [Rhodococcus globerulus]MDV6271343.1 hypothetical protein [Rhodococcus globerulus]
MKFEDPIASEEMLGESDWDDQDLLTIGEASTRLKAEIAHCESLVRELESDPAGVSALAQMRSRLAGLNKCLDVVRAGPSRLAYP